MNGNGIKADLCLFRPVTIAVSAASFCEYSSEDVALDVLGAFSEGLNIPSPGHCEILPGVFHSVTILLEAGFFPSCALRLPVNTVQTREERNRSGRQMHLQGCVPVKLRLSEIRNQRHFEKSNGSEKALRACSGYSNNKTAVSIRAACNRSPTEGFSRFHRSANGRTYEDVKTKSLQSLFSKEISSFPKLILCGRIVRLDQKLKPPSPFSLPQRRIMDELIFSYPQELFSVALCALTLNKAEK
jgi:hypothetical protein